jgi:hypothetical protein
MSAMGIYRRQGDGFAQSAQYCQEGSQFPQYIRLIREEYEVIRTP